MYVRKNENINKKVKGSKFVYCNSVVFFFNFVYCLFFYLKSIID